MKAPKWAIKLFESDRDLETLGVGEVIPGFMVFPSMQAKVMWEVYRSEKVPDGWIVEAKGMLLGSELTNVLVKKQKDRTFIMELKNASYRLH